MPIKLNASDGTSVQLSAPTGGTNNNLVLPVGNGTSGQVLQTDGSGTLSWGTRNTTSKSIAFSIVFGG
jgi:hypothetical protein